MEKDFIIIVFTYLIMVMAVAIILPINMKWAYACLLLTSFGGVLQWYWNKHFK